MGLRKIIGTLVVVLLASASFSQSKGGSRNCIEQDELVQKAFENLRTRPSLRLSMTYTVQQGLKVKRISLIGYWLQRSLDGSGPALFELKESDISDLRSKPIRRYVANGRDLAVYDVRDNNYSVTRYGKASDSSPARLFPTLDQATDIPTSIIAKLLKQVYGGDFPVFEPWLAGAYGNSEGSNIYYSRGGGFLTNTSITFSLAPLRLITGYEKTPEAINSTTTTWTLIIETVPLAPGIGGADFSFTPPRGAKEVRIGDE